MAKVVFSDGSQLEPDTLVYAQLPPENETEEFNEEVWNYMRKGPDKPTLVRIPAYEVAIDEPIFNLDGELIGTRVS